MHPRSGSKEIGAAISRPPKETARADNPPVPESLQQRREPETANAYRVSTSRDNQPGNIDLIDAPGTTDRVPMSAPDIQPEDIDLVVQVLRSSRLSLGPFLEDFERAFAKFIGSRHAVAVANGTAGLHLCIRAAGIADGDEVITTPFSFIATSNCILYERATPVFVDIEETSMNMDPVLAAAAVTERTRALLPVHVFGQPCAVDDLLAIARKHGLVLIEDACEAVGAEFKGRKVGTFGKAAVFSFYPNKQMTTGEGAIVTTDDDDWAHLLRSLRNQGRESMGAEQHYPRLGFNYRLNEMSAALGLGQLSRIEAMLDRRERVAAHYGKLLIGVPDVVPLRAMTSTTRLSWFVYLVRLAAGIDRARVMHELNAKGIPVRVYFPPIHLEPFYRERFGFKPGDFPVTERVAASTLALPFYSNLSPGDTEYIVEALRAAIAKARI